MTTFGPAFAERAIDLRRRDGHRRRELHAATYDKLSDLDLERMQLGSVTSASPTVARTGVANLELSQKMVVISGVVGVTDNFDVGVGRPAGDSSS